MEKSGIKTEFIEDEAESTSFDNNDKAASEHGSHDDCIPSSFVCQQFHMRSEHLQSLNVELEKPQMCPVCGENFATIEEKKSHILQHFLTTKTVWKCQKCGFATFDSIRQLQEHFHCAHVDTIYRCSICLGIFTEKEHLQEHLSMHTVQERKFKCIACGGMEFENQQYFEVHLQQIHMGNQIKIHQKSGEHELLQKTSTKKKVAKEGNSCRNFQNSDGNSQIKSTFKCIVCDTKCADQESLDKHRLYEHCKVRKGNTCTICRATLADFNDFMEHSQNHNESSDEFNCIICRQFIQSDQLLRMHGEFHLEEVLNDTTGEENMNMTSATMVECATCKKNVPEEDYAKHLLLHVVDSLEGTKPANSTLKSNESNIAEQQLSCSECEKLFESMELLNAHTILHLSEMMGNKAEKLQENPPKRSSRKRQHLEKEKCCRICDKYFQSEETLAEHVRLHTQSVNNLIRS